MASGFARATIGVLLSSLTGCTPSLRAVAARDLRCPEAALSLEGATETSPHTVRGCGKSATYVFEERCSVDYLGKSCGGKQWTRRGNVLGE